jgi:hypothetical protein
MGIMLHQGYCRVGPPDDAPLFLHDGASRPPNIDLIVATVDSGGDERASGIDHEDGNDSPTTDGVDLGAAAVV